MPVSEFSLSTTRQARVSALSSSLSSPLVWPWDGGWQTGWCPLVVLVFLCLALRYFKGLVLKRKAEKYISLHLLNCALLTSKTFTLLNVDAAHCRACDKCLLVRERVLPKVAAVVQKCTKRTYLGVMFFECSKSEVLCGFVARRDWCFVSRMFFPSS